MFGWFQAPDRFIAKLPELRIVKPTVLPTVGCVVPRAKVFVLRCRLPVLPARNNRRIGTRFF